MCVFLPVRLETVLGIPPWMATRWQCAPTFELKEAQFSICFFLSFQSTMSTSYPGISPLQFGFSRTPH